jgi:hypothetical protein
MKRSKKHRREFVALATQPTVSGHGAAAIWTEASAEP